MSKKTLAGARMLVELRRLAGQFRTAIERCPRARQHPDFENFPRGSCGDASLLLAKYLRENGHKGFVYVGGYRDGWHHWLQRDNLVVDITADQFATKHKPVIVEFNSQWHLTFDRDPLEEHVTDFEDYDDKTAALLTNVYRAIIAQLKVNLAGGE